jgi:hypothetical protein
MIARYLERREFAADALHKMAEEIARHAHSPEGFMEAFKELDLDGSGSLDLCEFTGALNKHGGKFSARELRKIFKVIDTNNDGAVDLSEFMVRRRRRGISVLYLSPDLFAANKYTRCLTPAKSSCYACFFPPANVRV